MYAYYAQLRTHAAWRVPLLQGRCPKIPDESATAAERGMYGLFIMLLFRPFRLVEDLVSSCFRYPPVVTTEDAAWESVWQTYLTWKTMEIEAVAQQSRTQKKRLRSPSARKSGGRA